jgi:hypothetical protein
MRKAAIGLILALCTLEADPQTPPPPSWRSQAPNPSLLQQPDTRTVADANYEDTYFDSHAGAADPLDGPQSMEAMMSAHGESQEDFPANARDEVFVAHFSNWASYLSHSRRSIYTIVNLIVDRVVTDKDGHITPGYTIPLAIPGGTVIAPGTQKVLSYFVRFGDFPLEPNTKYLVFLTHRNRPFFEYSQAWNVDKGVLEPVTPYQAYKVSHGIAPHAMGNLENAVRDLTSH